MTLWESKGSPAASAIALLSMRRSFHEHVPPAFSTARRSIASRHLVVFVQMTAASTRDNASRMPNGLGEKMTWKEIIDGVAVRAGFGLDPNEVLHARLLPTAKALRFVQAADVPFDAVNYA